MSPRDMVAQRCVDAWLTLLFWHTRYAPGIARALRPAILRGAWMLAPSMRAATRANAARLLGPSSTPAERTRLARAVVASFFDAVVEFGANRALPDPELAARIGSIEGEAAYDAMRRSRRGAILATAHLGGFETAMAMLARREKNIHVVFHPDRSPLFERLRTQQHARLGIHEARVTDGLPMWARLRDALANDAVVLMQADRVMPGQSGTPIPFFGGRITIPSGPAKLARLTGAPVVPVFSFRRPDGRLRIVIDEPLRPEQFAPPRPGEPDPLLLALASVLERRIGEHPEQWLCLHDAWSDEPMTAADAGLSGSAMQRDAQIAAVVA